MHHKQSTETYFYYFFYKSDWAAKGHQTFQKAIHMTRKTTVIRKIDLKEIEILKQIEEKINNYHSHPQKDSR